MRVIGFNLTKISIERQEPPKEKLEIKQNIGIDDISKDSIPMSKDEVVKIDFNFSVDYLEGKFAKIEIKGTVIILPEKDELKKILKSWKDKQIPEDIKIPLFNFIKSKCDVRALQLEDELGLPLHIPFPKLTLKKEE